MKKKILLVTTLVLAASLSFAAPKKGKRGKYRTPRGFARLNTQCELVEGSGKVTGVRTDTPYTIASVSKVFTSFWAVSKLGPKYRFPHKIYVTPITADTYDVHIAGSDFPYFDKTMLQYLASELNNNGVFNINTLTFDEHFDYDTNIRTNGGLVHQNRSLGAASSARMLSSDLKKISSGYNTLVQKSFAIDQVKMRATVNVSVKNVNYKNSKDYQAAGNTKVYVLNSSELYRVLKELNRNSNNFAANKIFEKLQNTGNFETFMKNSINVGSNEIKFYNGSGYPDESGPTKLYNKASCSAVVEMMDALRKILVKNGLTLKDIMPVAGMDASEDGQSTVTKIYGKTSGRGALLAKTGTVADTIALAGLMSTSEGNIYFHTSFNYGGGYGGQSQAYNGIRNILNQEFRENGKDTLDSFKPRAFLSFDNESKMVALKSNDDKVEKVAQQDFNELDQMSEAELHAYEASESITLPMM